jgi:arylsulfatase A-like enzyme
VYRIFAEGVRFDQAVTVAPVTRPAHATMMTGLAPVVHGVVSNLVPLSGKAPTLATRLGALGYKTAAFVGSSVVARGSGLERGFEHYDDAVDDEYAPRYYERSAESTTDRALAWLGEHDDRPFFLWVHYFDPHAEYAPPRDLEPEGFDDLAADTSPRPTVEWLGSFYAGRIELSARQVAYYRGLYRGEVRRVSREIGRLWDFIESRDYGEDVVLAVVGDHGEELADHGRFFQHNRSMYDGVMRVPLALRYPGAPALRVSAQVGIAGLAATLLDLAGGTPTAHQAPGWRPFDRLKDQPAALLKEPHPSVAPWGAAWREPPWKLLYLEDGREFLFDLVADPEERSNVAARHPEVVARLRRRLAEEVVSPMAGVPPSPDLNEATRKMLRSLGYLD